MDLTNEDVADILALLDSLPYDSLDVETPRFRLTLRRAPGGGWTEESQVLAEPAAGHASPERRAPAPPLPASASGRAGYFRNIRRCAGEAATADGQRPG